MNSPPPSPSCNNVRNSSSMDCATELSPSSSTRTTFTDSQSCQGHGKPFRLQATKLFLTYAQCPLEPAKALGLLQTIVTATSWIVARELHKDGHPHLHCFLELSRKLETRNARLFDLVDTEHPKPFHGKYESCRSPESVIGYCMKETDDFITNLDESTIDKARKKYLARQNRTQNEYLQAMTIMRETGDLPAALLVIQGTKRGARDLVLQGDSIMRNLRNLKPRLMNIEFALDRFPGWSIVWDKSKTLILSGPPNTGKTALAKALLPNALFVTHMDQLRQYSPENLTGIIFDEGSFKHMPREAQIHLTDVAEDRTVHCRYAPAFLPAGTPRIISTNAPPVDILLWADFAIRRRCQYVSVVALNRYFNYGSPPTEAEHNSGKFEKSFTLVE